MTISLSASMNAGLNSLLSTNKDVSDVQNRLNSGRKVNAYADNPALFTKSQRYNDKADALSTVNGNISQGLKNLDTVNKALDSMYKNMDGTLAALKDARAKAVNIVTQVRTAGGVGSEVKLNRTPDATVKVGTVVGQSQLTAGELAAARGNSMVGTDLAKNNQFQIGDTFAITLTDSATGSTSTRWFRAASTANVTAGLAVDRTGNQVGRDGNAVSATNPAVATDGTTEITAVNFNTLGDLSAAVNAAFGSDGIQTSIAATKTGTTGGATPQDTYAVGLALATAVATQSVSLTQVYNNDPTAVGPATNGANITADQAVDANGKVITRGATFDFSTLFGNLTNPATGATLNQTATTATASNIAGQNTAQTGVTKSLTSYTYSPATNGQNVLASALEARRQATDTLKAALYNYQNMVLDAAMPGFNNLLKGETVSIDLNETGEVKQTIKLGAVDLNNFGFNYFVGADGTVTANNLANNFNNDSDLDTTINRVNNMLSTLRTRQNALGSQTSMLNSRLDYNKSAVDNLQSGANDLTAADSAEEAANLAALTNRQNYALTNLSITKQAEQSLLQLLR